MVPARLVPAGVALLMLPAMGCSSELEVGKSYCDGGGAGASSETDCVLVGPEKDGDRATVGRLSVKSRPGAFAYVHRDGKKTYTLHRDGKVIGSIAITGTKWIEVTLTDGAPYKKTMRTDGPRGFLE